MNSPGQMLVIGLAAVALSGGMILFGPDGASPTLRLMQYLFLGLGVVGVIGALVLMTRK